MKEYFKKNKDHLTSLLIFVVITLFIGLILYFKGAINKTHKEIDKLDNKITSLKNESKEITKEKNNIQREFNAYKEKMEPYEKIRLEDEEAKREKAAEEKAIQIAEHNKKLEEEKKLQEKEEKQSYNSNVTYDQLARNPDNYIGEKVKFTGKVVQIMENPNGTIEGRLELNNNINNIIYISYISGIVSSRVLEGDNITVYGTAEGLITYDTVLGNSVTIPWIKLNNIEQ